MAEHIANIATSTHNYSGLQAMAELGRALRSQPAAFPLVLVAGSWRRAVQHAQGNPDGVVIGIHWTG